MTVKRTNQARLIHVRADELDVQPVFFFAVWMDVLKPVIISVTGWHKGHFNLYSVFT
ncbi:hypothetical protein ACFQUX_26850 [Pantoea stewartii]